MAQRIVTISVPALRSEQQQARRPDTADRQYSLHYMSTFRSLVGPAQDLSRTFKRTPLGLNQCFPKARFWRGFFVMKERIVRLRTHQKNIERYQSLLKTEVSDVELQYLEKRLAEERLAIAMLEFMGPRAPPKGHPDAPE